MLALVVNQPIQGTLSEGQFNEADAAQRRALPDSD